MSDPIWLPPSYYAEAEGRQHDLLIKVTVLDTETGERYEGPSGYNTYWWTQGNGSCDCNRDIGSPESLAAMAAWAAGEIADDGDNDDGEHACRSERYLVVAVEPMLAGYTIADFNDGYPEDLILKHIGPEGLR